MHFLVEVTPTGDGETVADLLWAFGAVGLEDLNGSLRAAFASQADATEAAQAVGGSVQPVADDIGLDSWREYAGTVAAGGFLIAPAWTTPADDRTLAIDPGRTFGSGSHPSTRTALDLVAAAVDGPTSMVDLGAGSGVLSVAAARLGALVTAFERDPQAEPVITDNALRNGVADRITVVIGDLADTAPALAGADLAVLNVTIDLHESLAPVLHPFLPDRLIVAGILIGSQEQRVAAAHHGQVVERTTDGQWAALMLTRTAPEPKTAPGPFAS